MRSFTAGLRVGASLVGLLMLALSAPRARADLHFEQPIFDAGAVHSGTPLVHDFRFVNAGPETIEVTEARASCGCLTPRIEPRVYRPGEHGSLRVEVHTLDQPEGFKDWRVQFCYRGGDTAHELGLHVTAHLITEVTVQPAALVVFADQPIGHEVTLTDLRPQPLSIAAVRTSSPELKSDVKGSSADPSGHQVYTISLQVTEDYREGRHDETLSIYTDDPNYRELRVPVTIVKRPRQRLVVRPNRVTLLAPPGQPAPSRIVLIQDSGNEAVVLSGVMADDPAVVCQWAQGPGPMTTVKVSVDRSRVHGQALQTTIHVHVSKPVAQELNIPLVCTLQ
ncbi:MAG TPA: DUF1573 domain-containing protein [Gemmataceae bacterium]|jgi:hypothetical protein|nr:DUF1573 domain-containing protein [Gemmataceae bacterium]